MAKPIWFTGGPGERVTTAAAPNEDWDPLAAAIAAARAFRLGTLRQYGGEPDRKDRVNALRTEGEKRGQGPAELFCGTQAQCREDIAVTGALIRSLFGVVRRYAAALRRRGTALGGFNDLEHRPSPVGGAGRRGGRRSRTLARQLAEQFEECWWTNIRIPMPPRMLCSALYQGGRTLFLVGDVKQGSTDSAKPCRNFHPPPGPVQHLWEEGAASIVLEQFPGRPEVTGAVIFVFRSGYDRDAGSGLRRTRGAGASAPSPGRTMQPSCCWWRTGHGRKRTGTQRRRGPLPCARR